MTRLKELRTSLALSQTEFSARIKLNQSYYSQIERGAARLNDRVAKLICDEFGVDDAWLRGGDGEPFAPPASKDAERTDKSVAQTLFDALSPEKQAFALRLLRELRDLQDAESR